jgi:hypothetical protein
MRALAFVVWFVFAFALIDDARAKEAVQFVFQVPAGWKREDDVTRSDAAQNSGGLNSNAGATVPYAVFAFNPASHPDFAENMNAVIQDRARPITLRFVREGTGVLVVGLQKELGVAVTPVESRILSIRGVDCGDITYDYTIRGTPVRATSYLLPGDRHTAIVTFSAHHDDFERHRALYEATIAATEGLLRPRQTSYVQLLAAPVAGMIVGTVIRLLWRRRSAKRKAAES